MSGRSWSLSALAALVCLALPATAALAVELPSPWSSVHESALPQASAERVLAARGYRTLELDQAALFMILDQAPLEGNTGEPAILPLPMPDGRMARFRVWESPILAPELARQFPEIRTFSVEGVDDPTATGRIGWTSFGFDGLVLSGRGSVYIDPWVRGDTHFYVSYDRKSYRRSTPPDFRCDTTGEEIAPMVAAPLPAAPFGNVRRDYKLALAATGEYTGYFGGSVGAFAEITKAINRINAIYERELAIHLILVANETAIIYDNPATDPYTNNNGVTMMTENQANLNTVIGSGSYDIGHVFSTGGGGIAGLGVVCIGGSKAHGVTGSPNPVGDAFYVDYVAHEIGHQFGAHHTFNGLTGACGSTGQRTRETAYEPGSASTIMGYAGICGAQNLQAHSDDYFHSGSLAEIQTYVSGSGNCMTPTGTNSPPAVSATPAGPFTVPKQTPFTLTAVGSDSNGSDTLTYTWEEFDPNGTASTTSTGDTDLMNIRPIFRSFGPTTSPSRTFPKLSNILSGATTYGESLPTRARTMTFRATVRDSHMDTGNLIGGSNFDDVTVTVAAGGPFRVTAPGVGASWPVGTTQTVTWDVANTSSSPVSCNSLAIRLSTDGGNTFPTVLAASVSNIGTASVTVPSNVTSTTARIKLDSSACGNVFFAISPATFAIAPAVAFSAATPDVSVTEGNAGSTTPVSFTVTLTPQSSQTVTVTYATSPGTATSGVDYVATTGTLTFLSGTTTRTLTVQVKGDTMYEGDETFLVRLTGANGGLVQSGQDLRTVTIQNDDLPPTINIIDAPSVLEGNSGVRNAVFAVRLSAVSGVQATVTYATADGTATAPADYTATTGTLSFAPGVTSRSVLVPVIGETACDPNETLFVNLSVAVDATLLADVQGMGTIQDDDNVGTVQFGLASYTASEAAATALIKVSRTGGKGIGSVSWTASDGTAVAGTDYGPTTSGTLAIPANATAATFSVPIVKDTIREPSEAVLLRLTDTIGCNAFVGARATAVLTITDNDLGGMFVFGAPSATVAEGKALTVTVRRSGGTASAVTVDTQVLGGTAMSGVDYSFSPGTLSFAAGQVSQTLSLSALPLTGSQGNRTILLGLANPTGGSSIGTPASELITLQDADASVQFSLASYTVSEASAKATIAVKRTGPLTSPLTVDYATSGGTATAGSDYLATTGNLSFAAGVAAFSFPVTILPDMLVEGSETVNLQITNASPGAIGTVAGASGPGLATLTLKDNDPQQRFQFSLATFTANEPPGTLPANVVVTVKRTGSVVGAVTVDYTVAAGTTGTPATGGLDYTATAGTLSFANGVAARTFPVQLLPDTADEGTETVSLTLSNPTPGTLLGTPAIAVLNIVDNEPTVQFSAANYSVSELALKATVTVVRKGSLVDPASVEYAVTDGTATGGSDYAATAGTQTLSFIANQASRTFLVTLLPELLDEPNETVNLTLSNPIGTALGTLAASTITILDNDTAGKVQLAAAALSVGEMAGTATVTVTRTGGTAGPATVDYATSDGTALAGTDYTATGGTLTFAPSQTSQSFTVTIADQVGAGPNRFLNVTLSNPGGNLTLGTQAAGVLWIVDEH